MAEIFDAIYAGILENLKSRGFAVFDPGKESGNEAEIKGLVVKEHPYYTRIFLQPGCLLLISDISTTTAEQTSELGTWVQHEAVQGGLRSQIGYEDPDFLDQIVAHLEGIKDLHVKLNKLIKEINRKNCKHTNTILRKEGMTGMVGTVICVDCGSERDWNAY